MKFSFAPNPVDNRLYSHSVLKLAYDSVPRLVHAIKLYDQGCLIGPLERSIERSHYARRTAVTSIVPVQVATSRRSRLSWLSLREHFNKFIADRVEIDAASRQTFIAKIHAYPLIPGVKHGPALQISLSSSAKIELIRNYVMLLQSRR